MDAFNTSLDAFEAELNRIEPLDLPALREYIQEHAGCSWEDACDWHEQITLAQLVCWTLNVDWYGKWVATGMYACKG